jgi:hypothetical protein
MSSLMIHDLAQSRDLAAADMSVIRGGYSWDPSINIAVVQNIGQFQKIDVNVLNGNGVIGADFKTPKIALSPTLKAENDLAFPGRFS